MHGQGRRHSNDNDLDLLARQGLFTAAFTVQVCCRGRCCAAKLPSFSSHCFDAAQDVCNLTSPQARGCREMSYIQDDPALCHTAGRSEDRGS